MKAVLLLLLSHASWSLCLAPAGRSWVTLPQPSIISRAALTRVDDGTYTTLFDEITEAPGATLVVLGTYAGDFNLIEYAQKLRHYLPQLRQRGISRTLLIVNGEAPSCQRLAELLYLPADIELFADPSGSVGRMYGVSRGWLPDSPMNPYLKLFGMLWGLGAVMTLPSVITGYLGNPEGTRGWIEDALAQALPPPTPPYPPLPPPKSATLILPRCHAPNPTLPYTSLRYTDSRFDTFSIRHRGSRRGARSCSSPTSCVPTGTAASCRTSSTSFRALVAGVADRSSSQRSAFRT